MGDFGFYLREGFYHITDWKGYDHILFVMALCLPYFLKDWKQVLILITAFTIGHSVTLALSVFNKILIPSTWIEFLIPITIIITALENLFRNNTQPKHVRFRYVAALVFGLIHGLGFSNYLRSMMGKSENIITQLLAFNIGLELGQLLIVLAVLMVSFIFVRLLNIKQREWTVFISGGIFGISFIMALERLPF
ncbi:HupE/UreJ family protein [Lacibacter sp.]|uniref:HupE/UreJ family protein n=1 Tax=Lacibacter sp. TaxID=1915409 RepID=UPI002B4AE9E2|nr:HupE/UreJ family protein [Lacibacter sp.]HLP35435.1 HupE/UreJ family protein [Lacibacter sp.]